MTRSRRDPERLSAEPPVAAPARRQPYPVAARELLRSSLLDAACEELRQRRWADVTMAEVALAAGVSRQTLYKEFGSREEFAQALVLREADSLFEAVERAMRDNHERPAGALEAAFDVYLTAAAENPLVRAVVSGDGAAELLTLLTIHGKPLLERSSGRLKGLLQAGWPLMRDEDAELLSECLVRLAISYAALPKGPANMSAASVATLLGPYVESLSRPART
jgi:AcrR family transcriptional regulator